MVLSSKKLHVLFLSSSKDLRSLGTRTILRMKPHSLFMSHTHRACGLLWSKACCQHQWNPFVAISAHTIHLFAQTLFGPVSRSIPTYSDCHNSLHCSRDVRQTTTMSTMMPVMRMFRMYKGCELHRSPRKAREVCRTSEPPYRLFLFSIKSMSSNCG